MFFRGTRLCYTAGCGLSALCAGNEFRVFNMASGSCDAQLAADLAIVERLLLLHVIYVRGCNTYYLWKFLRGTYKLLQLFLGLATKIKIAKDIYPSIAHGQSDST